MKMTFSAEEAAPADLLAETEVLYREIAGELAAVMDRVRRGEIGDGISGPFAIEIAQISETFGPGPFTRIEINE